MTDPDYKARLNKVLRIKRKLSKIKIGLPKKVTFIFNEGSAICFPREKKWILRRRNKRDVIHFNQHRNDVTKYRAKLLLKLAIANLIK